MTTTAPTTDRRERTDHDERAAHLRTPEGQMLFEIAHDLVRDREMNREIDRLLKIREQVVN